MDVWRVNDLGLEAHHPQVLASHPEARAIALRLPAGEALQEHQVHERAWLVVLDGEAELEADGRTETLGAGGVAAFTASERHEVRATSECELLLLLTPWPGEGHPGTRES